MLIKCGLLLVDPVMISKNPITINIEDGTVAMILIIADILIKITYPASNYFNIFRIEYVKI